MIRLKVAVPLIKTVLLSTLLALTTDILAGATAFAGEDAAANGMISGQDAAPVTKPATEKTADTPVLNVTTSASSSASSSATAVKADINTNGFPPLVDYDRLMKMTDSEREEYLEGFQTLLNELGAIPRAESGGFFVDQLRTRDSYALIETLFSVSEAAPRKKGSTRCGRGEVRVDIPIESKSYALCAQNSSDPALSAPNQASNVKYWYNGDADCSNGYFAVHQDESGNHMCVSSASFWAMHNPVHQKALRATQANALFSMGVNDRYKRNGPTDEQIGAEAKEQYPSAEGCALPDSSCPKSAERNQLRAQLEHNICFSGANISEYPAGSKGQRCLAVHEFCYGGPCRDASGNLILGRVVAHSCSSNEIICNPLIYGVKSRQKPGAKADEATPQMLDVDKVKPFCVSMNAGSSTGSCQAAVNAAKKRGSGISRYVLSQAGAPEAWADFKKYFDQICMSDVKSARAYCAECSLVGRHLRRMNLASRKGQCFWLASESGAGTEAAGAAGAAPAKAPRARRQRATR